MKASLLHCCQGCSSIWIQVEVHTLLTYTVVHTRRASAVVLWTPGTCSVGVVTWCVAFKHTNHCHVIATKTNTFVLPKPAPGSSSDDHRHKAMLMLCQVSGHWTWNQPCWDSQTHLMHRRSLQWWWKERNTILFLEKRVPPQQISSCHDIEMNKIVLVLCAWQQRESSHSKILSCFTTVAACDRWPKNDSSSCLRQRLRWTHDCMALRRRIVGVDENA